METALAFVLSRPGGRTFATAIVGFFWGAYLFYRGFIVLQRKRLIENTPTSTVRGAAMGVVEVNGLATGPYTIPAPVTGVPCYYYRSIAWQLKQSGRNRSWQKVADESMHVPFYLDDNTGRMLVNPQDAELDIHRDFCEVYSDTLFSTNIGVPSNVASFLARNGVDCDKKTKVEEFCIKPKNALFVLGTLSQNYGVSVSNTPVRSLVTKTPRLSEGTSSAGDQISNMHSSDRSGTSMNPEVIRLQGSDRPVNSASMTQQERISSALIKAGITNPAAWAVAGVAHSMGIGVSSSYGGGAAAVGTALEPFEMHPPVVLMKGTKNSAYFISWKSQRDVVKSLGWKSALMIWGGPAVTLMCSYVIFTQLGWL